MHSTVLLHVLWYTMCALWMAVYGAECGGMWLGGKVFWLYQVTKQCMDTGRCVLFLYSVMD